MQGARLFLLEACTAFLLLASPVTAAGKKSIFELGSEIDHNAVDVVIMYFAVFAVTMFLEFIVDHLHHTVTSESGRVVVHHITEEVMILGGISAILVVFENLGGRDLIDATLFHYIHFVIFAMAIFFIVLVSLLFITVERSWQKYSTFEANIHRIENDVTMSEQVRERFLTHYVKATKGGQGMWASITVFRRDLPPHFKTIQFSHYMKKQQRKLLLTFLDLTSLTWFGLALLVGVQAPLTQITQHATESDLAIIALWVVFVGMGPVLALIITVMKIKKEYRLFTFVVETQWATCSSKPPWHQSKHFWWGDPEFTTTLIQVLLLYQVFYLATVTVNFTYRLFMVQGGVFLLILCYLPSIAVFLVMLPVVMPPFVILSSVNDYLCMDTILGIAAAEKNSGRERRERDRDTRTTGAPPFIMDDVKRKVEKAVHEAAKGSAWDLKKEGQLEKMMRTRTQETVQLLTTEGERELQEFRTYEDSLLCHECCIARGVWSCEVCGLLCAECDAQYHKLRMTQYHVRVPATIAEPPKPKAAPPPRSKRSKPKSPLTPGVHSPSLGTPSPLASPQLGRPSPVSPNRPPARRSSSVSSASFASVPKKSFTSTAAIDSMSV